MLKIILALTTVLLLAGAACQITRIVNDEKDGAVFTGHYKGFQAAVSGMPALFVIIFAALAGAVYLFVHE